MKKTFLLIFVPALLVTMGFAQAPAASGNADPMNVKGCVGGSDGNYTVLENNTGKTFKITTSSTDLKAFVGQDVNLTGQKAGTAENSLAVTALNMISVHCTAAASAPAAAASAPAETISTPPAAAAAPVAAAPDATVSTPAEIVNAPAPAAAPAAAAPDATVSSPPETAIEPPAPAAPSAAPVAAAPAATVNPPQEPISTPPAATAAPPATTNSPAETVSAPAALAAVHRTRPSAQPRKPAPTPVATPAPATPVSKPVADAAILTAPVGPPPETASTPDAPAVATKASTGKSAGMIISIVVVVLLIGAGVPLYNRWKRQKLLNETSGQNLSFTNEAKSYPDKSATTIGRKAA
jgi:hypothetical protein